MIHEGSRTVFEAALFSLANAVIDVTIMEQFLAIQMARSLGDERLAAITERDRARSL